MVLGPALEDCRGVRPGFLLSQQTQSLYSVPGMGHVKVKGETHDRVVVRDELEVVHLEDESSLYR